MHRNDREDFDARFCNVIKHPDVINAEPVLRLAQPAEPIDAALAYLRPLVPQMPLDRLLNSCPHGR
jgi:hypothetical protein